MSRPSSHGLGVVLTLTLILHAHASLASGRSASPRHLTLPRTPALPVAPASAGPPAPPSSAAVQLVSNLPSEHCHAADGVFSSCPTGTEWEDVTPLRFDHPTDAGVQPLFLYIDHDPLAGVVHVMIDWVGGATLLDDGPYLRVSGLAPFAGTGPHDVSWRLTFPPTAGPVPFLVELDGEPQVDTFGIAAAIGFGPSPSSSTDHLMLEVDLPVGVVVGTDTLAYIGGGFPTSGGATDFVAPCLVPIQWRIFDSVQDKCTEIGCVQADYLNGDCCAVCPTDQGFGSLWVTSVSSGAASASDLPLRSGRCNAVEERGFWRAARAGVLSLDRDAWDAGRSERLQQVVDSATAADLLHPGH